MIMRHGSGEGFRLHLRCALSFIAVLSSAFIVFSHLFSVGTGCRAARRAGLAVRCRVGPSAVSLSRRQPCIDASIRSPAAGAAPRRSAGRDTRPTRDANRTVQR